MTDDRRHYPDARLGDTVHHLYHSISEDVVPVCGETPGPGRNGIWHTGHDYVDFLSCNAQMLSCCPRCAVSDDFYDYVISLELGRDDGDDR